ncbi:MAG: tetratricopeptide repeat protein [Fuerstiella sp.]|nr:tetratricopeptide repeat protein [Fuerstiella sp.]
MILTIGMVSGCSVKTDGPEVTLEKANILSDRGRFEDAVAFYSDAAASLPNRVDIYYRRGICYENLNLLPKALEDYSMCLEVQSQHLDALNNKGVVLAKLERYQEAAEVFTDLLRHQPNNVLGLRNRGLCQHDQGKFDEALADYAAAVAMAPHEAESWFQRGNVYLETRRLAEAEVDYARAIELDAEHAKAWMNRGVGRYNAGERKLAMQYLERASKLDENIIIPGIDWEELAPTAAEIVAVPMSGGATFSWEMCSAVAQTALANRGFEQVLMGDDYPSFRCSRLSAQKDGKDVDVFVGCETADSVNVALAAMVPNQAPSTRVLMILGHDQSTDDAVAAYRVVRFVENWMPDPENMTAVVVSMGVLRDQTTVAP